ncbi:MAG: hypothetical protein M3Q07_08385, partial [Pseudobdellovibrionaceae bacterium]|nr:hypothetical protein [Pseudobdellovibrionaceae bacterium]
MILSCFSSFGITRVCWLPTRWVRSAEIPQGIICPECRGEIKDQGKYREAVEIDVHPSRFVKRTV